MLKTLIEIFSAGGCWRYERMESANGQDQDYCLSRRILESVPCQSYQISPRRSRLFNLKEGLQRILNLFIQLMADTWQVESPTTISDLWIVKLWQITIILRGIVRFRESFVKMEACNECCMWTALAELSSWAQAENYTLDSFGRAESGDDILDTTSWVVWRISSSHASL